VSILAFRETNVLIQGITGKTARQVTEDMLRYGTRVVAGVRPGAAGEEVHGVPVYDSVAEACRHERIDASVLFIPAARVKEAACEAMRNGVKLLVIPAEHVRLHEAMLIMEEKRRHNAVIIGPNTPGLISPPEKALLSFVPAKYFLPGPVGVASRSGTLTYELVSRLTAAGLGQSTCIGVGGDRIVGLRFAEALRLWEKDPQTRAVLLVGEIGGSMEEEAAAAVESGEITKPVAAYLAGYTAPVETKLGHAGAMVSGTTGTLASKVKAFERAGIHLAKRPGDITGILQEILKGRPDHQP